MITKSTLLLVTVRIILTIFTKKQIKDLHSKNRGKRILVFLNAIDKRIVRHIMTNETLQKILQEKTMSFTSSEISTMIDEELEKPPEQMDTDFINYCLDVLEI